MSVITAGSLDLMVGTPINSVEGLVRLGPIRDLNLVSTVHRALKWLEKGSKSGAAGNQTEGCLCYSKLHKNKKERGCW